MLNNFEFHKRAVLYVFGKIFLSACNFSYVSIDKLYICISSAGTYLNKNGVFYLQNSYSSDINAKKRFTMDFSKITRLEAFGIAKY
jgi:hypothetical protein